MGQWKRGQQQKIVIGSGAGGGAGPPGPRPPPPRLAGVSLGLHRSFRSLRPCWSCALHSILESLLSTLLCPCCLAHSDARTYTPSALLLGPRNERIHLDSSRRSRHLDGWIARQSIHRLFISALHRPDLSLLYASSWQNL